MARHVALGHRRLAVIDFVGGAQPLEFTEQDAGVPQAALRRGEGGDPVVPGESPEDRRMREITYLNLTRFVQTLLDRKDLMSMATGLEVRVPFCDHRLVEYVFNVRGGCGRRSRTCCRPRSWTG